MSPNSLNYSPFTAVTGTSMLCPHLLICKDDNNAISKTTSHETIQNFIEEMQALNFYDFSTGDCHSVPKSYIPSDLFSVPKVWLRTDRVKKSLEAPYTGPYDVIERYPKYFVLKLPQGNTSVSVDRIKPAHLPVTRTKPVQSLPKPPNLPKPIQSLPNPRNLPSQRLPELTTPPQSGQPSPKTPPPSDPLTTRSGRRVRFNPNPHYSYF